MLHGLRLRHDTKTLYRVGDNFGRRILEELDPDRNAQTLTIVTKTKNIRFINLRNRVWACS